MHVIFFRWISLPVAFRVSMILLLLCLGTQRSYVAAQTPSSKWATVGKQVEIDDEDPKAPDLEIVNSVVYASWSVAGEARFGQKSLFGGEFQKSKAGKIDGDPTYFTTSIASGGDGTIHYVWIVDGRKVLHKSRDIYGNWSSEHTIAGGQDFANGISVAVQGANVFAIWRAREGEMTLGHSADNGATWTVKSLGLKGYGGGISVPRFAVSGSTVYVATLGADFYNYLGKWDGNTFGFQRIFNNKTFREPQIAVLPDGRLVMANRDDNNPFYAEQRTDGSWDIKQLATTGGVSPQLGIAVDGGGNVHIAWVALHDGTRQVFYALKKNGDSEFLEPAMVTNDTHRYKTNIALAVHSTGAFVELAWETFYEESPDDEWPHHKILSASVRTSLTPPPPPPPCTQFDNVGRCIEFDTSIGLLSTFPPGFVQSVAIVLLGFSGAIGALVIMYAGYLLIASRDKKEQVQKGRDVVIAFLIGALALIFSLVFLQVISVDILHLPGFK